MSDHNFILAIETSAKAASCAIADGQSLIAQSYLNRGLTHSQTLLPMITAMLDSCALSTSDVTLVAVANGPGSFTGIRIGCAAAKGLCWAADIPSCPIPTLDAIVWQLSPFSAFSDFTVCAVMDARRNQLYNALFTIRDNRPIRLCEDRAISVEQLSEELSATANPVLLIGDGADLCYNSFSKSNLINAVLAPDSIRLQSAWGVASAASSGNFPISPLNPSYLRPPQAVREKLEANRL